MKLMHDAKVGLYSVVPANKGSISISISYLQKLEPIHIRYTVTTRVPNKGSELLEPPSERPCISPGATAIVG